MYLTVTQRIGGGFALIVLLLLIISGSSYRSINEVNDQFKRTAEEIDPIMVHSADIAVALLSANNALLQFLASDDLKMLNLQEQRLILQHQAYTGQRDTLLLLAQNYPQVTDVVSTLDSQAETVFRDSHKTVQIHKAYLQLYEAEKKSEQTVRTELGFLANDIDDLASYGDSVEAAGSVSILSANLKTVNRDLNRILSADQLAKLQPLESAFNTPGYGLKAMEERLQKVAASGSDTAKDLLESLATIEAMLTASSGVVQKHKQRVQLHEQAVQLLGVLSNTITATNETLLALRSEAQLLADSAQRETRHSVDFTQISSIVISALSVLLAITIGIWVSRSIRIPLNRVMSILKLIADGDLSQRVAVDRKDEFGQLLVWVNELADKQESVIRDIQAASDRISDSARDTAGFSERTNQMMDEQKRHTTQVAAAIHQMSATAAEVAQNAEQAQYQVSSIDEEANQNRQLIQQNIEVVNALAKEIDRAGTVIMQLNLESSNIGQILEVIEGIAGQTNLLALNAAIEAARAGSQGRGFAVVADEVRNLASRTQNSTQDIQTMIEKLQSGARDAVTIMEISRREAQSSVDKTEQAGISLAQMVDQLGDVRSMSVHIATAAEQQMAVSQEIAISVQRIAEMAQQGSQDAQQMAEGREVLSGLAHEQQQLASVFKIREQG